MKAPVSFAEVATVTTTGQRVRVLFRRGVRHNEQIMAALEAAGHIVIGTPANFRYKRSEKRNFTRVKHDDVFILNSNGAVRQIVPADYFDAHYEVQK